MSIKKIPKRKNVLGKGLNALLKDFSILTEQNVNNTLQKIEIEQIKINPFQPRKNFEQAALKELANSIELHGIIQPLTVRQLSKDNYQLIAGERRLQAAKIAKLKNIPVYIRTANDQQMLELALIENIQRENLNPIEIAVSYQRLLTECQLNQEALGTRVGKDRTTVNNYLRLLKLPPTVQVALRDKEITMGHARALIGIENTDTQLTMLKKIIKQQLSVRQVEALASVEIHGSTSQITQKSAAQPTLTLQNEQHKLSLHFGTKVKIYTNTKNKGEITIPFVSLDDFKRILVILAV